MALAGRKILKDRFFIVDIDQPGQAMPKELFKSAAIGVTAGFVIGSLLSIVSGNIFVLFSVATLGLFVGVIVGIVHRNDP